MDFTTYALHRESTGRNRGLGIYVSIMQDKNRKWNETSIKWRSVADNTSKEIMKRKKKMIGAEIKYRRRNQ